MSKKSFRRIAIPIEKVKLNGRKHLLDVVEISILAKSLRRKGQTSPVLISSDHYLLSGYDQLEALRRLNILEIECLVAPFKYKSDVAEIIQIDNDLGRNNWSFFEGAEFLFRRDQILSKPNFDTTSIDYEVSLTKDLAADLGIPSNELKMMLKVVANFTTLQRKEIRSSKLVDKKSKLVQIARIKDSVRKQKVLDKLLADPEANVTTKIKEVRIELGELSRKGLDIIKPSNWWAFGIPYWRKDDAFAGSIPGEIYANALYYFAPKRGVAVDAMAGSGMIQRVYNDRDRWQKELRLELDLFLFDKYPRSPFAEKYNIKQHDITTPLPIKADWLFIDPPYFGISDHLYDGILASTKEYSEYVKTISKVLLATWDSLNNNGVLCFLVTTFIDINDNHQPVRDVPLEVMRLAQNVGYKQIFRTYVNRGEQQRRAAGIRNMKAKKLRTMFSDTCELIVFKKEVSDEI